MLSTRARRVWLAQYRVDFRKQYDGLLAEAFVLGLDPFRGDVVIFVNRNKWRIKVLYADETGLWVSGKRFCARMKSVLRFLDDPSCTEISQAELMMLFEGSAYMVDKKVAPYAPTHRVLSNG